MHHVQNQITSDFEQNGVVSGMQRKDDDHWWYSITCCMYHRQWEPTWLCVNIKRSVVSYHYYLFYRVICIWWDAASRGNIVTRSEPTPSLTGFRNVNSANRNATPLFAVYVSFQREIWWFQGDVTMASLRYADPPTCIAVRINEFYRCIHPQLLVILCFVYGATTAF